MSGPPPPRRRHWFWVLLLLALAALGCQHVPPRLLVFVLPGPLTHDIGAWRDGDQVCVPEPALQAVYVTQRCLSMAAIRALILDARLANDEAAR